MKRNIISLILIFSGIAFIVIGIKNGDAADVMKKAAMICLECVGIG